MGDILVVKKESIDRSICILFIMHSVEKHGGSGGVSDYEMKVTNVCRGDAINRQVSKSVLAQGAVINRQDEWCQV